MASKGFGRGRLGREVNPPRSKAVRVFKRVGGVIYDVNDICYGRALRKQAKLEAAGKALLEKQVKNQNLALDA